MLNYKLLMQQVYHCHCDYPSNKILNIHWFHSNNDILQGLLTRILLISPLPSGKHTKTLNYHRVSLTIVIIRYCLYALASGNPTGQARKSSRNGGFFFGDQRGIVHCHVGFPEATSMNIPIEPP